jgi:hypothetical protein
MAATAAPDSGRLTLHRVLSAEVASVLGVLCDLNLLDLLTQSGTIAGTVLTGDADLLGALSLFIVTATQRKERERERERYDMK